MPEIDLGKVVGPQGPQGNIGPEGKQGIQGPQGDPATINGVTALTLTPGPNVTLAQDGSSMEIGAVVPGKNLLLNWYLRRAVNQLGQNLYAAGLTVDRWKNETNNGVVAIKDNFITFTWDRPSAGEYAALLQYIENCHALVGCPCTLSVLASGEGTIQIRGADADVRYTFSLSDSPAIYSLHIPSLHLDANDLARFRIIADAGGGSSLSGHINIYAAKFELGDHQTLARQNAGGEWEIIDPPDYDLQYLLCSQYSPTTGEWVGLQHSNDNLLINSYWDNKDAVINQRGYEQYNTAGYSIDGLYIEPGVVLEIQDNGIVFTPDSSMYCAGYQFVENWKSLIGKQVTLSVLVAENTCSHCLLWFYGGTSDNFVSAVLGDDKLYSATMTLNEKAIFLKCGVQGRNSAGSVKIRGFKLELGPVQTLAHKEGDTWVLNDPPPNKALELAKCRRYYRRYPTTVGYFFYPNTIEIPIDITDMRAAPTASCDNVKIPGGESFTVVNIQTSELTFPQILIKEQRTDLGTGVYISGFTLDANL